MALRWSTTALALLTQYTQNLERGCGHSDVIQGNRIKMNKHYNEDNTNLNIATEAQRAQRKIFHFLGNVEFHFNFGFCDKQFHPFVRHSREALPRINLNSVSAVCVYAPLGASYLMNRDLW